MDRTLKAVPEILVEPLHMDLPEACSTLALEITFAERGGRRAVWIDPVVEFARPVPAAPNAPNLLVITSDTTRRDVLGPYGGEAATPVLDRLAAEGLVFTDASSAAFGTTPSHASLFTSLPAAEHGIYDNSSVLDARHVTLAEVLRDAGYRTAAFVSAQPVTRAVGLTQGFDLYDDVFAFDSLSGLGDFSRWERRSDITVDRFLNWFERRSDQRPFFVWLHFFDPHQPYAPPGIAGEPKRVHASDNSDEDLDREMRRLYRAEVEYLDRQLGRVFNALANDPTLIAFTADHGENFLDRGRHLAFDHAGLFPEVSRVPLILRFPTGEFTGKRKALITSLDLAPTLVDLLGIESPATWQGRSFRRILAQDGEHRPHVMLEGAARFEIAVRTHAWTYREIGEEFRTPDILRLLGYAQGTWRQLYDRRIDPEEHRDRFIEGDAPETVELERLVAELRAMQDATEASMIESETHREALKALGYLD